MKIDKYLEIIQEGYIFNDKTISINLKDFLNNSKNILLIVGVLGSGKTTLSEVISKKYKVSKIVNDTSFENMISALKKSERCIIEGIQIATMYSDIPKTRKLILNCPMIIIGMSAIKSGLLADQRDGTVPGTVKYFKDTYISIRKNLIQYQKNLNLLKKDAICIPNAEIKEFKLPEFIEKNRRYY